MSIRRTNIDRVNEASKSSKLTVGKGTPSNNQGFEGDLTFRRTSDGFKLFVKANSRWHSIKAGESFDKLEKNINELKKKVDKIKPLNHQVLEAGKGFKVGNTTITTSQYDVSSGDFTLDVSGDIVLDADGGDVTIKDGGTKHFAFDCDNTRMTIFDDANILDFLRITVDANAESTISTTDAVGAVGHLTIQPDGDLTLDPVSQKVIINTTDKLYFDGGTETYIHEVSTDKMELVVGGDEMITLDEASDRITLEATKIAYKLGSDGDEWSVADSAWAGTIIGYCMIGEDEVHNSYTLTTSFVTVNSAMTVRFEAPPSGAVEVEVQIYFDGAVNAQLLLGLSDAATYNTLGAGYEVAAGQCDESDQQIVICKWGVTGLTAGDTYNYWLGAKKVSGLGSYLNWGGTGSGRWCDFTMKVTALPTAVANYAEYD